MTEFINKAIAERKLGLALHYPLIHAMVIGMEAKRTLEFGAGGSTRVFVDGHMQLEMNDTVQHPHEWEHRSISTESRRELQERHRVLDVSPWVHAKSLSIDVELEALADASLDLVLHDGSHAAEVVADDVSRVWSKIRPYGLLLVHDTQHSYCGQDVRAGVRTGLALAAADFSETTLPYGFGLTIIRKEGGAGEPVRPPRPKFGGEHDNQLAPLHVIKSSR